MNNATSCCQLLHELPCCYSLHDFPARKDTAIWRGMGFFHHLCSYYDAQVLGISITATGTANFTTPTEKQSCNCYNPLTAMLQALTKLAKVKYTQTYCSIMVKVLFRNVTFSSVAMAFFMCSGWYPPWSSWHSTNSRSPNVRHTSKGTDLEEDPSNCFNHSTPSPVCTFLNKKLMFLF